MSAAVLLWASTLALPQLDDGRQSRLPPPSNWDMSAGEQTSADVELIVAPNGAIAKCTVMASVGSARLANEACKTFLGRGVPPATDDAGNPTFGWIRIALQYTLHAPGVKKLTPISPIPDLQLTVNTLPHGADKLGFQLLLLVSTDGLATVCEESPFRKEPAPAAYVKAACDHAKGLRAVILRRPDGEAVAYVKNLAVRFVRSEATAAHDESVNPVKQPTPR